MGCIFNLQNVMWVDSAYESRFSLYNTMGVDSDNMEKWGVDLTYRV